MNKIIVWERDDPFDDEYEEEIQDNEQEEELESNEAEITNEEGQKIRVRMPKSQEVIHTNFGPFLAYHPDNPYNSRDIWVANTNFDITQEHINIISRVAGVEAFRAITRYSFTIIIGLVFYPPEVLSQIDNALGIEKIISENANEKVETNKELIDGTIGDIKAEFWYAYIMPNGETVIEEYENEEVMDERKPFFIALDNISEGLLLTSKKVQE